MLRRYNGNCSVDQGDYVAFLAKSDFQNFRGVVQNAENAYGWRGIDRFAERLVVEAYVAAGNGRAEIVAGYGQAVDRFAELPHDIRLFRAAEVQAIGRRDGTRTAARYVARGFGHGVHRAGTRIQLAPAPVAIRGKRQCALN